jgi:starch synthase
MSKKRVLFVTQAMKPYTTKDEISDLVNQLAPYVYNKGFEVRVLMPKYGLINERRHRLHEVVRLSGMNIIVDDDDFPLIIKVASLPGSRMQVYFLDNEEFFKRKFIFHDEDENLFEDNADRMVFFCKGVMETVKKFGWSPDIIHCHGWMTSLIPLYFQKIYKQDPIFEHSKVIYSVYEQNLSDSFDDTFFNKATINDLEKEDLSEFHMNGAITLHEGAIKNSDGIIIASENLDESVSSLIDQVDIPKHLHTEGEFLPQYMEYFKSFLEE